MIFLLKMVIFHCYVSLPKVSFERYLNRCSSYFCAFSRGYSTQFNVLRVCVGRHKDILWPCCRERERERAKKKTGSICSFDTCFCLMNDFQWFENNAMADEPASLYKFQSTQSDLATLCSSTSDFHHVLQVQVGQT